MKLSELIEKLQEAYKLGNNKVILILNDNMGGVVSTNKFYINVNEEKGFEVELIDEELRHQQKK